MLQISLDARWIVVLADRGTQVGPGLFARIIATEPFDLVVTGDPDPAPEMAVVPPYSAAFSTINTDSPWSWARSAAVMAPAPEPTTTTS